MLLKDKWTVITGCNRGIGLETLKVFAREGSNIIACSRIAKKDFTEVCNEFSSKYSVEIKNVTFDLEDVQQTKDGVRAIKSACPRVNILINNAAIASGALFNMTKLDEINRVFQINYIAPIILSQGISRSMMRAKSGCIINISSNAGIYAESGMTAYGSSKAALNYVTKVMATELAAYNIRVNAIAPGVVETEMLDQMEEKARSNLIKSSMMKRPAKTIEVANTALYLASELAAFVTGQVIGVDGGRN